MNMLTSYTKILFFSVLLLSACATQDNIPEIPSQQDIDKAIKSTSDADIQKYSHAIALISAGELEKAQSELLEFTEEHPQLAGPWANLALIDIKQNKLDEAEKHLKVAIARNPDMAQVYNLMGYLEKSRGHIIKARDHYIKAIQLKDNYAIAHYNLALIYDIYMQDIQKAVLHYKKYMSLNRKNDKRTADWLEQLQASLKKG